MLGLQLHRLLLPLLHARHACFTPSRGRTCTRGQRLHGGSGDMLCWLGRRRAPMTTERSPSLTAGPDTVHVASSWLI